MRGSAGAKRRRPRILIGVTGSVAAVKVPELCAELCKFAQLKVVFTQSSRHFFERAADYNSAAWEEWKKVVVQPELCEIVTDEEEWASWGKVGDAVTHIALREWADAMVVAPLSANTLAKLANGMCDNLLTCVARAWDFRKALLIAPAMNTCMWDHPLTKRHLHELHAFGPHTVTTIPPVSKTLACGDTGTGALASVMDIRAAILAVLRQEECAFDLPDS